MAEEAGEDNFFLFGLNSDQVQQSIGWYNPVWHYERERETREALDAIFDNHFSRDEPGIFEPLRDALLKQGDRFRHLADLKSYCEAQEAVSSAYRDPSLWTKMVVLNIAGCGMFSSDRSIREYASEIWNAAPCPIEQM
jgi:starch phosphorylase